MLYKTIHFNFRHSILLALILLTNLLGFCRDTNSPIYDLSEDSVLRMDYGLTHDTFSVKLTINASQTNEQLFLYLPKLNYDYLRLTNTKNGEYYLIGQNVLNKKEFLAGPNLIVPVTAGDTFILDGQSNEQLILQVELREKSEIDRASFIRNILSGIFIGIIASLLLYNLFLFYFLRDTTYLYYVLYLLFMGLAQLNIIGFDYFIFKESTRLYSISLHLWSGFAGIFAILFVQKFLNTKVTLPKFNWVLIFIICIYVLVVITAILKLDLISYKLVQLGGVSIPLMIIAAVYLAIKGSTEGLYIAIGWSLLIVGSVLYSLTDFGIIPSNSITNYMLPIGVAVEAVLLSIALAHQINILKKDNEITHNRVIHEVQRNEELVKTQNVTLERKVMERTQELQSALDDLKAAQSQLVQSEKMASLGVLTAGIAHEINNPINFVTANIVPLRDNIAALTQLVREYKACDKENLEHELIRLQKLEEELELEYVLTETPQLIDAIEEGAKRTHTIVDGLKTFSRGDAGKKGYADINAGIKSTVSVLKSRLNQIKVKLNLAKDLPEINCQIGKINQVVLNLINNSIDALDDKNGPNSSKSVLQVTSFVEGEFLKVRVEDNANGIRDEIKDKIMEPFYTTKAVGKGTGLGLSISYSIIEEHGGHLTMESEIGKGSSFIISLPLG